MTEVKSRVGVVAKEAMGFRSRVGFYLWAPNQNRLLCSV